MGDVGSALGGVGKFAIGGAAALLGATVAIGGGLLDLAKDAAPIEGITNAFKALATSAGQDSDALIAHMTKVSMGLVDDGDLMTQYTRSAQLMGATLAGQLPDAYQYLAKVAAASGQDVGVLMDDLVNGVGRVTPKIMTQLGVTVDMEAANKAYAASIGKNVDQLTKSDKQTAIFNATMEQLKKNTAAMPDVTNLASTKMQQFNVKFADMKETLGTALLPMLGGFMDLLSHLADTVLPIITPIIESLGSGFATFFQALDDGVNPLTALGDGLFKVFGEGIRPIVEFASKVGEIIGTFISALQKGQDPLQAFGSAIWDEFGPVGAMLGELFFNISAWITGVALPALQKFGAWFTQDVLPAVVGFIQNVVIPAVGQFIQTLIRVWNDVSPFITKFANWFISDVLPLVVHYIKDVVIVGIQDFINILVGIWNLVQPTLDKLYKWFISDGLPAITNFIQGAVDNFIKPFIDTLAGIMLIVGPILGELKDWFVKDGLPGITNFINDAMKNFITPLINLLKGLWDQVKTPLQSVVDFFKNTFSTIGNFIKPIIDFIKDIISKATDAINLLRQIGGAPSQTSAQIVSAGLPANMPTLPGRDSGGSGRAGGAYMIGRGAQPEMFIPSSNGTFIPNADKAMGGYVVNLQSLVINASGAAEGAAAGTAFIGVLDEWQSRGNR